VSDRDARESDVITSLETAVARDLGSSTDVAADKRDCALAQNVSHRCDSPKPNVPVPSKALLLASSRTHLQAWRGFRSCEGAIMEHAHPPVANRLSAQKSPYLLQHAHNPVELVSLG